MTIPGSTAAPAVQVFAALGEPHRQALLSAISTSVGGASVTALAEPLQITRQAVDKHVRILERAGLVEALRSGREVRYSVRPETLRQTRDWIGELEATWDARLGALKRAAEAAPPGITGGSSRAETPAPEA